MNDMESIGTVVNEIMSFLGDKAHDDKIHSELLQKIISISFYASLQHEEGVSLQFDLIFLNPEEPDPEPPLRIRTQRWKTSKFSTPMEFNESSIAKLGLATDRRTSSLAIYVDDNGMPLIWGLVDQGTNTHLFDTHESSGGWPHPGVLHISVRGVGKLVITHQSEKIIEINQNQIVYPALDVFAEGHLRNAINKVVDNLADRSNKYAEEFGYNDQEDDDSPFAFKNLLRRDFQRTLCRIILRIQDYGHGGAFIITPNAESANLNIKYKVEYDRLAEALVRHEVLAIMSSHYHAENMALFDNGRKSIPKETYLNSVITDDELSDSEQELTGSVWFTSLLSRVDGLIVFDETLSVRGFGAEILVDSPATKVLNANTIIDEFVLKTARPIDPSKFGTRHRSMMRYINKNPDAIGVVISQDGEEKIMINIEGNVVYWNSIKLTVH